MTDYFKHDTKLVPGTKARAEDVNARFDGVVDGFAKLPAPHATLQGFSDPVPIGAPTALTDAASVDSVLGGGNSFGTDTGIVNAYVVDLPIAPSSYREGLTFTFKAVNGNTGPSTINLNSLGVKTLSRPDGSALVSGDIANNQMCSFAYDGTKFLAVAAFKGQFDELVTAAQLEVALAASSATSAGDSETQTGLDAVATAADRVQTGLDVIATATDLVETNADVIATGADLALTNADVVTSTTQAGISTTKAAEGVTTYNNTLAIFGSAVAVQAAVDAAEADKVQTGLDRVAVAADLVVTNQDTVDTAADVVAAEADKVQTGLDRIAVAADLVQTNQDTIDTAADLVATAQDVIDSGLNAGTATTKAAEGVTTYNNTLAIFGDAAAVQAAVDATAADLVATNQDTIDTAADLVATNQDTIDTAADRVQTGLDRVQTGLDVIGTAADLVATNQDTIDTAADLVQTGLDTVATAADRVQTGLDVVETASNVTTCEGLVAGVNLEAISAGMAGRPLIVNDSEDSHVHGSAIDRVHEVSAAAASVTLDCESYDSFYLSGFNQNITIDINLDAGRTVTIFLLSPSTYTITWDIDATSAYWNDGAEVEPEATGITIVTITKISSAVAIVSAQSGYVAV